MFIFISLAILCLIGTALYLVSGKKQRYRGEENVIKDTGVTMFWISFVVLIIFSTIWISTYPGAVGTLGELRAFKDGVYETYASAVVLTKNATIQLNMDKAMFSAENAQQSSVVSERIKELRDKVAWYNETIAKYQANNKVWFLDPFYPEVPEDLTPIKLVLPIK